MKIRLLLPALLFTIACLGQTVELQIFITGTSAANSKVGFRIHTTTGTVKYQGLTFYLLYQSANTSPSSVDDSKLTTGFGWGVSTRFINTVDLSATPITIGNQVYDRQYVYGNIDETSGSHIQTLTTNWDTVLYITFANLQASFPQGGYVYAQKTAEAPGVSLTDENFGNISVDVTTGTITLGASGIPTPVRFTKFNAQCGSDGTSITWSTATESNNSRFDVQKSTDASSWTSIGSIAAASANSNTARSYRFTDKAGGTALYRIKQVDVDGAVAYTDIVRTNCSSKAFFVSLYPVPAKDKLTLVIGSDKALRTTLHVLDNYGRVVMKVPVAVNKGINNFTVNIGHLTQGQYYIRGNTDGIDVNERFVISR